MPTKRSSSKKKRKTTPKSQPIGKEKMKELFDRIDIDGNNEIDCHELLQATFILRLDNLDVVDIAQMIQEADLDGNGTLDFYEFATVMEHCTKKNSDWQRAGRAARLFKGMDQGLVHVHELVNQSSVKNEDGEYIPTYYRVLGDVLGDVGSLFFNFGICFCLNVVVGARDYNRPTPLAYLFVLLMSNIWLIWMLKSRSQRHFGHVILNLRVKDAKSKTLVTSFWPLFTYSMFWQTILMVPLALDGQRDYYESQTLSEQAVLFLLALKLVDLCFCGCILDPLFGQYITTPAVSKKTKQAGVAADKMVAKVIHNEHIQRYATREGMRWCCSFLCREFFRRS